LTILLGNPQAVIKGKRFVEYNLNRMIREDLFLRGGYESERARVIAKEINNAEALLDIHSCSAQAPPHALPASNKPSFLVASK
jgi:succinylglutamate desuccinylase